MALAWSHRWAALPALIATIALQGFTVLGLKVQGLSIDVVRHWASPEAPAPAWPRLWGAEGAGGAAGRLAPPEAWGLPATIAALCGVVLVLALLTGVARYIVRVCDELFVQACIVDLRTQLYERLQQLSFRYFDTHDSGQIINRLTTDANLVRQFIQGVMIRAGITVVTLAIFLSFMLREHVGLTLACLAVIPVQLVVMVRYARRTKPMFLEQARLVDVVVGTLQESIAGSRETRAFGRESHRTEVFDRGSAAARDHRLKLAHERARSAPIVQAGNIVSLAVLVGFGGWLVLLGPAEGGIALGTLWVFRGLLERLGSQVEAVVMILGSAPEALAGAERVFTLIDEPREIDRPASPVALPSPVRGRIELRNVAFGYAAGSPVLEDVSLIIEPGETVALVGATGAGKSTLLSLIPRFYDPDRGSVLIDGVDVREADPRDVRRAVACVFQDPFLFSHTIATNIAFGRPDAGEETIRASARDSGSDSFVEDFEDRYETIIGERGVSLSGGQRQRLTIARALLIDAPILILDDATGAVDSLTESRIQRSLDRHRAGRTTIIVAHRLSTLRRADRIVVMDHGRIVDVGTHDQLLNRPGHYRAAALIQLALDEPAGGAEPERGGAA